MRSNKDLVLTLFIGCLAMLLFLVCQADAAEMECFTDEPKVYKFDIKDQTSGTYMFKREHQTGRYAGIVHQFVVKDVSDLNNSNNYLLKFHAKGRPYTITYALYCKVIKNI